MAITVTPTVDLVNVPARVQLSVSASAGETVTTVTRLNPDGTTVPVRTSDGNPLPLSAGAGVLYDYEMPYAAAVSYSSQETPATVSAQVTVAVSQPWLIHPGVPALSQPIDLLPGSLQDETYPARQGVFYVMGRSAPVVQSDWARKSIQSQLVILLETPSELDALRALMADAGPLLLNLPPSLNLEIATCYVVVQDVKVSRLTGAVIDAYRQVTLPFVVVDRPAGGSQSQRTWADVVAKYSTWSDVMAAYPTWLGVVTGP